MEDDEEEVSTEDGWNVQVSIPLPLVTRTSVLREDEEGYEERDSYSQAPLYPYHPTQVGTVFIFVVYRIIDQLVSRASWTDSCVALALA